MWIFGGIKQRSHNVILTCVLNQTRSTIKDIILQSILSGTEITNDCWIAYNTKFFEQLDYTHDMVNHSQHFKNLVINAYTNTIEATWGEVKRSLIQYSILKDLFIVYFIEYNWRQKFVTDLDTTLCILCEFILEYHGSDSIDFDSNDDVE